MAVEYRIHENIPLPHFDNLFEVDGTGRQFWRHWMGEKNFADVRPHFQTMGRMGALATPLSDRADKNGPVLRVRSPSGERIDRVEYHPDYHRLEEMSYGNGIVAIKYEDAFLSRHRSIRHLVGFGAGYYFAQSEEGLYCPICMTDGVGRVLERHAADNPLAREVIARIASRNREELWQGAMFLTEKQGGSDVGANEVQARRKGDRWLLSGDKWFCSNVDAEAILALARLPGGEPGTRGLGLFLVLRERPEGNSATIRIHRLKDKLGVRSMPSGECTFEDTEAYLIGGAGHGFKQMAEMLNLSRIYNAVASVGGMRRATLEALAYGAKRRAFGRRLWELPLWRSAMADLLAEFLAQFVLVFETARTLDLADNGDPEAAKAVRLLTPIAKALSGKEAVFMISECMEQIGGNAYIEEHIMPRLLRDAQVLPIWEGTTHILSLDALRAVSRERAQEAFSLYIRSALDEAATERAIPGELVEKVRARVEGESTLLGRLAAADAGTRQRGSREWIESAGRTFSMAMLLRAAAGAPALRETCVAAVRRLLARPYGTAPVNCAQSAALQDTEEVLLRAGYAAGA